MRKTPGILGLCGLLLLAVVAQADAATIFDVQLGYFQEGDVITIDSAVVTATGRYGFFIQATAPDPLWQWMYSGIWVYAGNLHLGQVHRGDLVTVTGFYDEYYDFSEIDIAHSPCGQSVDCRFEVLGTAEIPAPVVMRIDEVNDSGPYNEAYESVLIRVDRDDNTLFARAVDGYGEWYVATTSPIPPPAGTDSLLVDTYSADPQGDFDYPVPAPGTPLSFVQGILTYSYGKYKLAPRNCLDDLGTTACPPELRGVWAYDNQRVDVLFALDVDQTSAEDEGNYSFDSGLGVLVATRDAANHRIVHLTTVAQVPGRVDIGYVDGVRSEGHLVMMEPGEFTFAQGLTSLYDIQYTDDPMQDASPYEDIVVTITGRVAHVDGNYYFLQEGEAGEFQHLYGRVARTGALAEGDSVRVAGRIEEYYGSTDLSWTSGVQLYENLGPATQPVIVTDLPPASLIYDARALGNAPEPWEDALVRIAPAPLVPAVLDSVNGEAALYGEWWLLYGAGLADSCRTDLSHRLNDFGAPIYYDPACGDSVVVSGICRFEYDLYRVVPRRQADLDIYFGTGVGDVIPPLTAHLAQNRPNPFARTTTIAFRLEEGARAAGIEIFDVTGACVRHLLRDAPLSAGEHTLAWDGRADAGHRLASGTYYYRLTVDGRSQAREMVRLD